LEQADAENPPPTILRPCCSYMMYDVKCLYRMSLTTDLLSKWLSDVCRKYVLNYLPVAV